MCLNFIKNLPQEDGQSYSTSHTCTSEDALLVQPGKSEHPKYDERKPKIVLDGMLNFSFGKNGRGLTDELIQIGEFIKTLSNDNYVYIDDAFIDGTDDVYDLKFHIVPHENNDWMIKDNAFGH